MTAISPWAAAAAVVLAACGGAAPPPSSSFTDCSTQEAQCEAACASSSTSLPGSSDKEPALRGDIEGERCRARCKVCRD
jgi:hypothetical protein